LVTASSQIYVRDLSAHTTSLESVTWDGAVLLGGQNSTPTLSRNGRYLAFESTLQLDNRSDHDVNTWDVYLRDRGDGTTAATTAHVSHSDTPTFFPTLDSRSPSIAADGNFLAFQSNDFGLVPGDGNGTVDVFLYDRASTALTIVSRNDDNVQANSPSTGPSLSEHGGLVLFASAATNLVPVPFTDTSQLYLRNLRPNQAPVLQPVGPVDLVEAQPLHLNGQFSDDDSSTSWNATVDYGDGAGKQRLDLASDKTFVLDHVYAPGAYDLTVEVTDDAHATGSLAIHVAVTNVAPVVNLPSTLDLGFARTLDVSGTFRDPGSNETYSATVDYGDGAGPQTLALGPFSAPVGSFTLHHTYASAGTYNVAVAVSDGRGAPTTANLQIYLRPNQAPVLQPVGPVDLVEAQPLHLNGQFSDDDSSTSWNATVDYGDGAGKQRLDLASDKTFVLDHVYAPGAYDLTVEVTDDAHATGSLVIHVVVSNVAPSVSLLSTLDLAFSRTLDRFGTFVDPGSNETYAATVNYGDGTGTQPLALGPYSSPPNVGGSFTLHHTYASAGTYSVAVNVSDGRGDPTTATLVVKVGGYSYEFQDPVASSFIVGRNLPVKFTVRGPDGTPYFDPTVQVDVIDESGSVMNGPYVFGDQPSRAVTYSGDSYHVNVDTRDLVPGMYWLRVKFSSPTLTGEFTLGTTGTATGTKSRPVG
jgi:hypothetical protein